MRVLAIVLLAEAVWGQPRFRLSDEVRPVGYRLNLTIRPERPVFAGAVEIDVFLSKTTRQVWLNAKDLTVSSASITAGGGRQAAVVTVQDELLGLALDRAVGPGNAQIMIAYSGKLDDKLAVGAYRRSDGRDWYAYTTFTAIEARRAIPCFDQPEFKTPWRLTLHVPAADVALANAPAVKETAEGDGLKAVEFAATGPLPSEVVAFAVGPFDLVEDGVAGKNSVPVRLVTPRGRGAESAGVRGAARTAVARLEEYTGIAYPWQKLDQVAVLDMPFGAVENPGLITFRERGLLAGGDADTAEHRFAARRIIAHELAHQWFGNLVTQRWWDDVWLSEAFATWLGTRTSDLDLPEFERGIAAATNRALIMEADQRAVRLEINSRKDAGDVYSRIVYEKGAAVLNMVEHWLGADAFQRGLKRYLREHANGNATTDDLARALREESGADVAAVFASYLDQPGFPLVRTTLDCANKKVVIEQVSKLTWTTPVCAGDCVVAMGARTESPLSACPAWTWPNGGGVGYFRSESGTLSELLKSGWNRLRVPERMSIAADVEQLPVAAQMAALTVMVRDRDAHVVAVAERALLKLATTAGADIEAIRKLLR